MCDGVLQAVGDGEEPEPSDGPGHTQVRSTTCIIAIHTTLKPFEL